MNHFRINLLLAILLLPAFGPLAGFSPAQTSAELVPKLVPWNSERFFMGIVNPNSTFSGMEFTLDGTMTTAQGHNYYGIGIRLRTPRAAAFKVTWQRNNQPDMDVRLLGQVDCPAISGQAVMLQLSTREGLAQTGRESPGAGLGPAAQQMNVDQPSLMYECDMPTGSSFSERGLRILLPELHFVNTGRLVVQAVYPAPVTPTPGGLPGLPTEPASPTFSDPLILHLRRGAPRLLVIGDSVAWGQGVPNNSKTGELVFRDMFLRYGTGTRIAQQAHSGAAINLGDTARIADISPSDCLFQRELDGEIPRHEPTVQCQILRAVRRDCFVDSHDIGVRPVPFFFCVDGLPIRLAEQGELRFDFDLGPSYDVVLLWACINDVNALDVVTSITGILHLGEEELTRRVARECDLRNGLADIREFLPNARIVANQYHLITSQLTDVGRANCTGELLRTFTTFASQAALLATAPSSILFRDGAAQAQRSAAAALNATSPFEPRRGRGSIEFMEFPFLDAPSGAMWASDSPMVFPLICNATGKFAAVDPVRSARVTVCARLFQKTARDPFRVEEPGFMQCVRASSFHPNVEANRLMAQRLIAQRQRIYPRMLNFSTTNPVMVNPNGPRP